MKLLSICVPTYNRSAELAELSLKFLTPALDAYPGLIDVLVCDNSDIDIALTNESCLDRRIQYRKNEINRGFAGNLLRCATEADSIYVWIISDDDPILWPGFVELMTALPGAELDGVDCLMLPFQTRNNFGDISHSNRHTDWHVERKCQMSQILQAEQVPFILFSSAVVRIDKSNLTKLASKFIKNDYLQVILFLTMLRTDSKVEFITDIAIDYQPEYQYRFSLINLADSMNEVIRYLFDNFQFKGNKKRYFRIWLVWLAHHRGGLYIFKNGDAERLQLLARVKDNLNLQNLMLSAALLLPRWSFKRIYIWLLSFNEMRRSRTISVGNFRRRVLKNRQFVDENIQKSTT